MIFFAQFAPKSLNLIGNWVPKSLNLQNHLFTYSSLYYFLPVSPTSLTVLVLVLVLVLKPPFSSVLVTVEGYGKVIAVIMEAAIESGRELLGIPTPAELYFSNSTKAYLLGYSNCRVKKNHISDSFLRCTQIT